MHAHPALGDIDTIPADLRPLFDSSRFRDIRSPKPADWLAVRDASGQSFEAFVASNPHTPDEARATIHLQPLGAFTDADSPSLETLQSIGEAFFQMPVDVRTPLDISAAGLTRRDHPQSGHRQFLTTDVLGLLLDNLPDDAFCVVGITMADLYPQPDWNFVFGQASLRNRVGVYSFARYQSDDPALTLRRSAKVMAHEAGHMFGIKHCPFFECLMNGTNNLPEADRRSPFLCPVDLRKLMWSVDFDPVERYRELAEAYETVGLETYAQRAKSLASV